jgi:hypothetical protein
MLELVKDHLIPHITGKNNVKCMYDVVNTLCKSVKVSMKILLRNKLTTIHMSKIDTIESYLMKIVELRDQIVAIRDTTGDNEIVQISLNGFSPS